MCTNKEINFNLKLYIIILSFIVVCLNLGCGSKNYQRVDFLTQNIKDSNLKLFKYWVFYGRDGMDYGYAIRENMDNFIFKQDEKLPITYIEDINNKEINVVYLVEAKDQYNISLLPIKSEKINIEDITLNIDFYEMYSASSVPYIYNECKFESFLENGNNLIFYGVRDVMNENDIKDTLVVNKYNVEIIIDSLGIVADLRALDLRKESRTIYKYNGAEIIDSVQNCNVIYVRKYKLSPVFNIIESEFSNYGMFKSYVK